ncbi:hypothetical protein LCGC14_2906140, partial [marine sediment metagenome]
MSRSLSATLNAEQKKTSYLGLARIVLTLSGQSTQTYTQAKGGRVLDIKFNEDGSRQSAEVFLDNTDGVVSAIAFKGYKGI